MKNVFTLPLKISMLIVIFPFFICNASNKYDIFQDVDLFIGTANDCGQMDPSATIPFGMIKVGPDAIKKSHVGYDYYQTSITGFSINRTSGVGCSGAGGNITMRPTGENVTLKIDKNTEYAEPGFYSTKLSNGTSVSLTCTERIAYEHIDFEKADNKMVHFDFSTSLGGIIHYDYIIEGKYISGKISGYTTCQSGIYSFFYCIEISGDYNIISKKNKSLTIQLEANSEKAADIRIAVSPLSIQDCKKELQHETRNFHSIKKEANEKWRKVLNKIKIKGGTKEQRKIFYTSLYRTCLSPVNVTSSDGLFRNTKGEIEKAENYIYYSSWSLWDTYRTKFPLLVILEPQRMKDIGKSLIVHYMREKKLWSTENEVTPTTRTDHAPLVLLDMIEKGIELDNLSDAYPYIKDEVISQPTKSPDQYLEVAYDYWALGKLACFLDKKEEAYEFLEKSDSLWTNIWKNKFMNIDKKRFDIMHGDGLYEGTLWQYRWAVPYNTDKLIELTGGKERFIEQLSYFFENNLYNHGNQPDLHAAFLFNKADRPDLTQKWVTKILTEPMLHRYGTHDIFKKPFWGKVYSALPEGYIPEMDDDDGTMSAWFVFASIGMFPLTPGSNSYELCEPLFDEVIIDLGNKNNFIIQKKHNRKNNKGFFYLNGRKLDKTFITHEQLKNSKLVFD